MKNWLNIGLAAAMLFGIAQSLLADDRAALTARLHNAEVGTSLDTDGMAPWHLKLDVQLYDAKGKPTEQGTVEEWWAGPKQHLVTYSLPSYSGSELQNADGVFRTKDIGSVPEMVELLMNQVIHPTPATSDIDESVPELRKQNIGNFAFECIMLSQPIEKGTSAPMGLFPTYCFDPGDDSLRLSYDFGSQTIIRNRVGIFKERSVPLDFTVDAGDAKVASAHISALTAMKVDPVQFAKADTMEAVGMPVRIGQPLMAVRVIYKAQPIYPSRARQNRVSGSVVMNAVIGRDGHVHSLRLVSVPDPDLAISALAAVRQWTYKPYLLDGAPVEVETQITVNYQMMP